MLLGATFFDLLPESIEAAHVMRDDCKRHDDSNAQVHQACSSDRSTVESAVRDESDGTHSANAAMRFVDTIARLERQRDVARVGDRVPGLLRSGARPGPSLVSGRRLSGGLNTMMLVTRGEKAGPTDLMFLGTDAIAPVIGALLALRFLPSPKWLAIFLALASGFFLYTATSDLLPEAHRRSPSPSVTILTIVGVLIMALAVGLTRLDYGALQRFVWSMF